MTISKNILLTGGRSPVALDLARKFKKAGHQVFIAESIKYPLCRYSNVVSHCFYVPSPALDKELYIKALVNIIQAHAIDILIPTCEEIFTIALELATLKALTKVCSTDIAHLNQLHHKFLFNQLLKDTGIAVPNSVLIHSLEEYRRLLEQGVITYPHVLKPAYSRFAAKIQFVEKATVLDLSISPQRPWLAQSRIDGTLLCTYSLCVAGQIVANVFYRNDYSAGKNGAGLCFERIDNEPLWQWLQAFIKKIHYTGQIGFDVIQKDDGSLWPIECNPRATSGIHLFSDADALPMAFLGDQKLTRVPKQASKPMLAIAMLLYGGRDLTSLNWWRCFLTANDVIFRMLDPLPALAQVLSLWHFWRLSVKKRFSLIEASTHDIEWNGP